MSCLGSDMNIWLLDLHSYVLIVHWFYKAAEREQARLHLGRDLRALFGGCLQVRALSETGAKVYSP